MTLQFQNKKVVKTEVLYKILGEISNIRQNFTNL